MCFSLTVLFILCREQFLITRCFILQSDKNLKNIWYSLKHYDLHHAIFGGSLATGDCAVPTTDPYMQQATDVDDYVSSGDEEQDDTTMDTWPHFGDKRLGLSRGRRGKQKRGSTRADYESNLSALASVLVSRFDTGVSSTQSRQSGPWDVSMDQVVDIVGSLPDLTKQQIIGAFEFF